MSDSEDDLSSSDASEIEDGDDDIDMGDADETIDPDNGNSDVDEPDMDEIVDKKLEKYYQKQLWQTRKLPYSPEIEEQADKHFILIKKGLADSVLLNDGDAAFCHWANELEKYIDLYARRFSKEEHIQLVKMLLPFVKKGAIFRNVKVVMRTLYYLLIEKLPLRVTNEVGSIQELISRMEKTLQLLDKRGMADTSPIQLISGKRNYLTRDDLVIDWRPLYELYVEVTFKNLEEDGLFLMPDGFRTELHNLIFLSRSYFSDDSVQEILDECRPYMSVWDESCIRAWKLLELFTTTNFSDEKQKTHGAGLWYEEAWYWFEKVDNNSLFENHVVRMFSRLSIEAPGFIDWSGKLDSIFTKLIRSLRLGNINGLTQIFSQEFAAAWIIYMLGTKSHNEVLVYLKRVFNQIESFLHPSNNGLHTSYLLGFLSKLSAHLLNRIKREREERVPKVRTHNVIPEHMRLTQDQLNEFVSMMLPLMKLMAFTKTSKELVNPTFRYCCLIAPKVVLPVVLDMVYPALETLVEPHRLLQTMGTLLGVLIPLVKDEPDAEGKTYRVHAITILNSLLPGLDCNDISKCMTTYQIIGVLVNMVPFVDCSDAVHTRCDLTEDEKELCSATANFDSIISMLMDRMIEMLIACGQNASTTSTHGGISAKTGNNIEDQILHRGTLSVFKGICRNTSTELFKVAFNKVYNLACEHVFDSKIANDVIADMMQVSCKFHPKESFPKFFKLILSKLQNCITPEFYTDEKVDFSILWWLTMASRIVKVHPKIIHENWEQIRTMLDLIMPFKRCSIATEKVLNVYDNLLEQLTSIQLNSLVERRKLYDMSSDQFLPIRHWASGIEKKTWNPEWIIPTQQSIDRATELFRDYLVPTIDTLNSPHGLVKKELLHRLWLIRSSIVGACFSLPLFEGENIPLVEDSHTIDPVKEVCTVIKPAGTPEISIDDRNVRQMALDCVIGLIDHLLENSPDDVKSIQEAVTILRGLPSNRGYTKESLNTSVTSYKVTKVMLCDKLAGNKANIEMIAEEYLMILHRKRLANVQGYHFKQQHQRILETLLKVSTSTYSQNRAKAQAILLGKLREHPYSYKCIIDKILWFLDPANNVSHEQLKGALFLLIDGKRQALCLKMAYEQQAKIWPALIRVQNTEKPSIIALLESAQNLIVDNYESHRLKYECPENQKSGSLFPRSQWSNETIIAAKNLLTAADEGSPLHNAQELKMPSAELISKYEHAMDDRFANNLKWYNTLIERVYALAIDPTLHWRPIDMAHSMLSMQVRRDMPLPGEVVKMFVKLLISDTVKTRRIASAVVASWLKITKPKAVKHEYVIPFKEENTAAGAKFPINCGLREDNRIMMYEEEKLPTTDEEWDNFQFCGKQHWGIYTWPKKLMTYAPLKYQTSLDRCYEDLNETEKSIVDIFRDEQFLTKLRELFSIEMKKEDDIFNAVHFSLFQGLFRCYNDILCPNFMPHLDILLSSTKEYEQKLASEIVAGIVNGSKLWKYEKQRKVWNWLGPMLSKTFEVMKEDGLRNWGVAIATVCGCSEARMLKPLIDILFKLLERPTDNAFSASSRLFLVQSALCQFEWRGTELFSKLMGFLKNSLVHQYANLRERIAVCLVSATWYDMPSISVAPTLPARLVPPRIDTVTSMYQELLSTCWDEVRVYKTEECPNPASNGSTSNDSMVNSASTASLLEVSEVKKAARLTLKATVAFIFNACNQSYVSYPSSFIPLLPLLCHYANDVGDEELQKTCASLNAGHMDAIYVSPENAPLVLATFNQILTSPCWWKAKVVALRMIRMLVFSNPFIFLHHRDEIGMLLVNMLNDCQIEVRERAAEALSTLLQAKFFETTEELVNKFSIAAGDSNDAIVAHGGVLGLSAIVLAFPYTVPNFLPGVLMTICRFATHKNATIRDAVKRALSEFKRTHQDSWREHETQFNEDQLMALRNLLISPNYYV